MDPLAALKAPFPPERLHWRIGSTTQDKKRGLALAYIDARDVMERLDEVLGPDNWQCRYTHGSKPTICEIGIRAGALFEGRDKDPLYCGEWLWKANGAGDTDVEPDKGACSDAFKRAAVVWGVGRDLYAIDSPWVDIEPAGKSWRIARHEHARLASLLGGSGAPPPPDNAPPPSMTPGLLLPEAWLPDWIDSEVLGPKWRNIPGQGHTWRDMLKGELGGGRTEYLKWLRKVEPKNSEEEDARACAVTLCKLLTQAVGDGLLQPPPKKGK